MNRAAFRITAAVVLSAAALAQAPPAAPVAVDIVQEQTITPTVEVLGATEPKRRSVVAASIEGYVVGYNVDEGMRVRKGAVLALLRDSILRLQLKEAEAALAEIRERHANAKRDLERAEQLIETDAVTKRTLDARATEERALAFRIPQSEAKVEILKQDIAKKKVTAPFDGQIVREHTEVGEWLARGGQVATLVDISSVYVRVSVPERYVRFLTVGQEVSVQVTAAGEDPFRGRVVSVSDEGDPDSRTFPVRVEIKNEGLLRAGMSARVEFPAGRPQKSLVVSKDAILLQGRQSYVFVVGEGGRAERRDVATGVSTGNRFAVLRGLRPGDKVVIRGNERIRPGAPLRIVEGGQTESGSD